MKYIPLHILKNILLFMSCIFLLSLGFNSLFGEKNHNFSEGENHIAIILDVSHSMNVRDIGGDSRINVAKENIREVLKMYAGYNFSLNIFAGESQRILPFSTDISLVSTFLHGLDSNNLTKQGSRIDLAFQDALASFSDDSTGHIIVFTDGGEDMIDIPEGLLKQIYKQELNIHIVGIGSKQGGHIPMFDDFYPYKMYQGKKVISSLNQGELMNLSKKLGGSYLNNIKKLDIYASKGFDKKRDISHWIIVYLFALSWFGFLGISIFELYRK